MRIAFAQIGDYPYANDFLASVNGYEVWQITDTETKVLPGCKPFRVPKGKDEGFVLWRARAYAEFNMPALYIDNDTIVQHELESIWQLDFDVALTRREHKIMLPDGTCLTDTQPFNGGVLFVKHPEYWPTVAGVLETLSKEEQMWYGDQIVIAKLVNAFKSLILPCSIYNYTPNKRGYSKADLADKWIVHFKGDRKDWMMEYARGEA